MSVISGKLYRKEGVEGTFSKGVVLTVLLVAAPRDKGEKVSGEGKIFCGNEWEFKEFL